MKTRLCRLYFEYSVYFYKGIRSPKYKYVNHSGVSGTIIASFIEPDIASVGLWVSGSQDRRCLIECDIRIGECFIECDIHSHDRRTLRLSKPSIMAAASAIDPLVEFISLSELLLFFSPAHTCI